MTNNSRGLAKEMCEVIDNLDRAITSMHAGATGLAGLRIVRDDMMNRLSRCAGIHQMEGPSPGDTFNPNKHHAVALFKRPPPLPSSSSSVNIGSGGGGIVVEQVERPGFLFKDNTLLRPAYVVVSMPSITTKEQLKC